MTNIEKKGYQPVIMRIYNKDRQLVLEDEVLCAYDTQTNKIEAIGREARKFTEDNQIAVVNPLKWGVVADYTIFEKVIKLQLQKVMKGKLLKTRLAFCVPAKLSEVERRAYEDAFYMSSSFKDVYIFAKSYEELLQEPLPEEIKEPGLYVELVSDFYASEYFS
ncbi:MAG: rod shape-determining protein [Lachnospiraceae bacterium]|nr:rod shape-determining protein [Lachnospiraceae bacterium]